MLPTISHAVARPLIALWLAESPHSWRRAPVARDSPHVHAPGLNPDRILLTGDGISTGRGVLTHDLGLPGYLARDVTSITGRATDVDIIVSERMTAATCLNAIADVDLLRFDAVVLSIGVNEALSLCDDREWEKNLDALLERIDKDTAGRTKTYVFSIPFLSINPNVPPALAEVVDRRARALNEVTQRLLKARPDMNYVVFDHADVYEAEGTHAYQRWAGEIAPRLSLGLDLLTAGGSRNYIDVEEERSSAASNATRPDKATSRELDRLTASARRVFGTDFAAVTLIEHDTQHTLSAAGMACLTTPRSEALCDMTIRRNCDFIIEDASRDFRYGDYESVAAGLKIRFYAGYPIESPEGHRIGALCVMDTQARNFSAQESSLLRDLAHTVQEVLWKMPVKEMAHSA